MFYASSIMTEREGTREEAGLAVKLWAGICRATGWRCRCPKCGGSMRREMAVDESYRRRKDARGLGLHGAGMRMSAQYAMLRTSGRSYLQLQITPVYDVCTACGHRIRRRNEKRLAG